VTSIRAAVVTLSPVIVDIITTLLSSRMALNIVLQMDSRDGIESRLSGLQPDLVLIGLRKGETDVIARDLLRGLPSTTIIALTSDGSDAFLHYLRPHRRALRDISPHLLIRSILASLARATI
jgi:chemotaxis response regulator CheB